jgi:hypothetical protein
MNFLPRLDRTRRYHPASLELNCFLTVDNKLVESDDYCFLSYFDDDGCYKGPDQYGIEPIFTDESVALSDMAVMLLAAGERFSGNDVVDQAECWVEFGFTAETAWEWVQIGCWASWVAREWRDAGLTPDNVKTAAESLVDNSSEPDVEWTDSCPIYSCCDDDTDPEEVIEEHEHLTGKAPLYGRDGLRLYDLDPAASQLWVVAGPDGWKVEDINPDSLPDGFRWVSDEEWQFANSRR